jgi:hypothetical protein
LFCGVLQTELCILAEEIHENNISVKGSVTEPNTVSQSSNRHPVHKSYNNYHCLCSKATNNRSKIKIISPENLHHPHHPVRYLIDFLAEFHLSFVEHYYFVVDTT